MTNKQTELRYLAEIVANDRVVTVTFANQAYLDVLHNWLNHIEELGIDNVMVVSLDSKTHDYLVERDVPSVCVPCGEDYQQIVRLRLETLHTLNYYKFSVLQSDVDAVWLKNPLDYLANIPTDLIFSQGTVWPPDVHENWGFTVCCGFAMYRPTCLRSQFWNTVRSEFRNDPTSDQRAVNLAVAKEKVSWDFKSQEILDLHDNRTLWISDETIVGSSETISVGVLPHRLFQRIVMNGVSERYVVHPTSDKGNKETMDAMRYYNLIT